MFNTSLNNPSGGGLPDYTAGVAMSSGSIAPTDGVIVAVHNLSDNGTRSLTISGVTLYNNSTGASYLNGRSAGFEYIVKKGVSISWYNFPSVIFYPFK